jgi:hypothetical protein
MMAVRGRSDPEDWSGDRFKVSIEARFGTLS